MKVNSSACLLKEVTNPGQNENQGLPTLCKQLDREGDIEVIIVSRMNTMTGEVEEEERGLKPKKRSSSSEEIGKRIFSVSSGTAVGVSRCVEAVTKKLREKKRSRVLGQEITGAFVPSAT